MKALNNAQILEVSGGVIQILLSVDAVRNYNWSFTKVVCANTLFGAIIGTLVPMILDEVDAMKIGILSGAIVGAGMGAISYYLGTYPLAVDNQTNPVSQVISNVTAI